MAHTVIMKRDDGGTDATFRKLMSGDEGAIAEIFSSMEIAPSVHDAISKRKAAGSSTVHDHFDHIEQLAEEWHKLDPRHTSIPSIIRFLLRSREGRDLARELKQEQTNMTRVEKIEALGESIGKMAKAIIAVGASNLSEHEFTKLVTDYAVLVAKDGETREQAFDRVFMGDEKIKAAHQICKGGPGMPAPAIAKAEPVVPAGTALAKLQELAAEEQRRTPGMTMAKAFTKVCDLHPDLYRQEREEARARLYIAA